METSFDIAVCGGGASGLAAACAAGAALREAGSDASVVVIEAGERVGRTILKTGNGRCNFSNAHVVDRTALGGYRNSVFVGAALDALGACLRSSETPDADAVLPFFERLGLAWREEDDGRRYPLANKASVVLDVLRAELDRLGVTCACGNEVVAVEAPRSADAPFTLRLADGQLWRARAVVMACGGAASGSLEVEGADALPAYPTLGPLRVSEEDTALTRRLDNIRVKCAVTLARPAETWRPEDGIDGCTLVRTESGELLFRAYGVSGICVFNLSREAEPGDMLFVNFLPHVDPDDVPAFTEARRSLLSGHGHGLSCGRFLRGLVLPRVADVVLDTCALSEDDPADDAALSSLIGALTHLPLVLSGIGPADVCQVHRGGFAVDGFDPQTCASRAVFGLYACGEALDVDGPCGGYNLHWAWASGLLAGHSAAQGLARC